LILKATLLRVEVIALLGFDNGRETPDEENSKNNIRRGIENEREKEGCRKDSKNQDWKDGVREHLSERPPDGVGATSHRQGRLNGDSASICLGRVVVAQNETYRALPCTVGVISPVGGFRRTPSPTLLETIHAIQKRRNPAMGQSEFSAGAFFVMSALTGLRLNGQSVTISDASQSRSPRRPQSRAMSAASCVS
jgi:hypothetical protein